MNTNISRKDRKNVIMKKLHRACTGVVFFMLLCTSAYAQITVSDGQTAAVLAQKLAGQGVIVLNPVLKCPRQANGLFTAVNSTLGLDSGIVLTTGRAATVPGSYGVNGPESALASYSNAAPGDSTLTQLAGQNTLDACRLEFDVVPAGDTVSIDYVFGSEEYISAVCGPYNDAFAFFISGPGIAGADNMALVPVTDIPVTINSINNGIPGSAGDIINCLSMGPGSPFTSYYRDNTGSTTLTYKGITTILKAMHRVSPCDTYHFRIAIADARNAIYDSGVFLKAGSLKTGSYMVQAIPPPGIDTPAICIKGCLPGRFVVHTDKIKAIPQTIRYAVSGTAVAGTDYTPLSDSVVILPYASSADVWVYGLPTALNGMKTLRITIFSPTVCGNTFAADSAYMHIYDTMHLKVWPVDTLACRGDSIRVRVTGEDIYTYHWVPDMGLSSAYTAQPAAAPVNSITYTVVASVPGTACPQLTDTFRYEVRLTPTINSSSTVKTCYKDDLQLAGSTIEPDNVFSYYWQGPATFSSTQKTATITNAQVSNAGIYTLTVTNDTNGCKASAQINALVTVPQPPDVVTPQYYCLNSTPVTMLIQGHSLHWYDMNGREISTPVMPTDVLATYTYYVTDMVDGCMSPQVMVEAEVARCCDGDIFIPSAFTPNNDGLNDVFRPRPDFSYSLRSMEIYNRWGQVIYSSNEGRWDGTFNREPADAGVYFYRMQFHCLLGGISEKTGSVTLIR